MFSLTTGASPFPFPYHRIIPQKHRRWFSAPLSFSSFPGLRNGWRSAEDRSSGRARYFVCKSQPERVNNDKSIHEPAMDNCFIHRFETSSAIRNNPTNRKSFYNHHLLESHCWQRHACFLTCAIATEFFINSIDLASPPSYTVLLWFDRRTQMHCFHGEHKNWCWGGGLNISPSPDDSTW